MDVTNLIAQGLELHRTGKLEDAARTYEQAAQLAPQNPDPWQLQGVIRMAQGKHQEAATLIERAIALGAAHPGVYSNLGAAYRSLGRPADAVAQYERALALDPNYAEAHYNRGISLRELGKPHEAVAAYLAAVRIKPAYYLAYYNLGNTYITLGKMSQAVTAYQQALAIKPDFSEVYNNLGSALMALGQLDGAINAYRRTFELRNSTGELNLANAYLAQGRHEEAQAQFRRAIEIAPRSAAAHSNLLLCQLYQQDVTLTSLRDSHRQWENVHARPLYSQGRPHTNSRDPDRPLRIGFVSADLMDHPLARCLAPVLEHLDRTQCHVTCYAHNTIKDAMTARLSHHSQQWREIADLSDEGVAEKIRADEIDVLIDLSGHTAGNRLLIFARRPAPVQATWMGYPATTGMEAIDYLICDRYLVPPEADPFYSEKIVRLPHGTAFCEIPAGTPEVGPLPALTAGHVMLGSFNNPAKITSHVIATWAKIMHRLPTARLWLKFKWLQDASTQQRLRNEFASHGISDTRLLFEGPSLAADMMACYNRVDLSLDPFPYTGGTTTCLALWMGVPVVTCPQDTMSSRQSLSVLSQIGFTETIARDVDDYVELAVALAGDLDRLSRMRAELRGRIQAAPVFDPKVLARDFLAAMRTAWRAWLK